MAFVRRKGNQLAVVHGVRNPDTQRVEQQTLFTLYSKAEALAAIGEKAYFFRQILESEHPALRFDWAKIEKGIRDNLGDLPDLYGYKKERAEGTFRAALRDFTRELLVHNPQTLISSARLLQANRHELSYLRELIDWRLKLCEQEDTEFNQDNPFYWRMLSHRREVPTNEWEKLGTMFEQGRYSEAEALARLLIECWPNFAHGINYLGLIEMERGRFEAALVHFDEAIRIGRTLFPKRVRKSTYWTDHDTRPYIRAIIYKAQTLSRLERFDEALALCDRLNNECGQDVAAAVERCSILLNSGAWKAAIEAAMYVHHVFPEQNFPLAFALFENGDRREALVHFLLASLKYPRAAKMLLGIHEADQQPETWEEAREHSTGVDLCRELKPFLQRWRMEAQRFFKKIVTNPQVVALIDDAEEARRKWRSNRGEDRSWYDRMTEMESIEFARAQAQNLEILARAH